LAERYGPGGKFWKGQSPPVAIRAWEIGNEPNLLREGFYTGGPVAYRAILRAARQGLRRGDPRARVVFAGLSHLRNPEDFLEKAVKAPGGRCLFDAVGFHPYGDDPDESMKRANRMVKAMRDLGLIGGDRDDDVQLWITEVGWGLGRSSDSGPVATSPTAQAKFIATFARKADEERHAWRLGPTFWYSLKDAPRESGWAAHAGIYGRPAWGAVGQKAALQPRVRLPPVRCPGT
jgi:hypothetical protein